MKTLINIAILLLIVSTAQAQRIILADETDLVFARRQTYIETVNSKIAKLCIKEFRFNRYSIETIGNLDTVFRLSIKRIDTTAVKKWFNRLKERKIDLRRI